MASDTVHHISSSSSVRACVQGFPQSLQSEFRRLGNLVTVPSPPVAQTPVLEQIPNDTPTTSYTAARETAVPTACSAPFVQSSFQIERITSRMHFIQVAKMQPLSAMFTKTLGAAARMESRLPSAQYGIAVLVHSLNGR
jgi:hypothetical protein